MEDKKTTEQEPQGGVGRTNFMAGQKEEPAQKQQYRDISDIDRQEGTLDHGVKGGNFDEEKIDPQANQ